MMLLFAGLLGLVAFAVASYSRGIYNDSLQDLLASRDNEKNQDSFRKTFFEKGLYANTALAGSLFLAAYAGYIVANETGQAADPVVVEQPVSE